MTRPLPKPARQGGGRAADNAWRAAREVLRTRIGVAAAVLAMSVAMGGGGGASAAAPGELAAALAPLHAQYDPAERMLRRPFSSPGYHTTLKGGLVHPTRDSLRYAVLLLDTGEDRWRARAADILDRLIGLQDQDPSSRTYGIWSWFLEEPLARMSPPDWNWADFCGVALLEVRLRHRDRLEPGLAARLDAALRHAAASIRRRNVGPAYTNIALMGTYVTLVAAESLGDDDLRGYALARLQRVRDHTRANGGFTEYNSPTYTIVALEELGRLRRDARDPAARPLIEELYRVAWEEIARHFHAPTRQWAGPHSRAYRNLLDEGTLDLLRRSTQDQVAPDVRRPSATAHILPLPCPADLVTTFLRTDPRDVIATFLRDEPPLIGTTRLEPAFALGTINRGDLWNQRRPLIAYWGSASAPAYLRLRCLRDDDDFAAAQFFSRQRAGAVLAAVNFATDGGQTHVSLDRMRDAVTEARELRLRFEFGGAARDTPLAAPAPTEPVSVPLGGLHLRLQLARGVFGGQSPRWETRRTDDAACLDLVLWERPAPESLRFADLEDACVAFTLFLGTNAPPDAAATVTTEAVTGTVLLQWEGLRLRAATRPAPAQRLHAVSAEP